MRIGIDARFFGSEQKGLGRYSQKLIEKLEELVEDEGTEYYIFLRKINFDLFQPKNKRFKKVLAEYSWYGWREQIFFPLLLNKYKIDLMHFCHFNVPIFYRRKFLVTIHDLILFHFPTVENTTLNHFWYFFKKIAYHLVIRSTAKRAKKIIAVSDFTKKDIEKEFKIPGSKIIVTKEGFDINEKMGAVDYQTILKKYDIINPYLLYVGNAYPHKNLEKLCEAFELVKKEYSDLSLVIVGGEDYFFTRLKKYVRDKKISGIIFPGFISDMELDVFYEKAELFVFPSLYEGFGIPPLEALAKKVAVASSDRTSMPEVLGEAAQYFNPENLCSITNNILVVLNSRERKEELIKKGEEILKKFSWKKMARETLDIYKREA